MRRRYCSAMVSSHRAARLVLCLWSVSSAVAQESLQFVPKSPMVQMGISDLPALHAALPGTLLGRLVAEGDVVAAIEVGRRHQRELVERWLKLVEVAAALPEPVALDGTDLVERAVLETPLADLTGITMYAALPPGDGRAIPMEIVEIGVRPANEGKHTRRFEDVAAAMAKASGFKRAAEQNVFGVPGHVFEQEGEGEMAQFGYIVPRGAWLVHLPGRFLGGTGKPADAGRGVSAPAPAPGFKLAIDPAGYVRMMSAGGDEKVDKAMAAFGLDNVKSVEFTLRFDGELVREDVAIAVTGKPKGLLGALVDGMAPLVDQPLPEGGLLQVRFAADVERLCKAGDELLELADLPTIAARGLRDDLRRAWTGGIAISVCSPATAGVVPRLYLSFGIADEAAARRVLDKLLPGERVPRHDVDIDGIACTQLELDGAPPAFQPAWCFGGGALTFAECGASLRAQIRAAKDGAPKALDTGAAPVPEGKGARLPSVDVRFDGAAIYTAVMKTWRPLWDVMMAAERPDFAMSPWVSADDMPDVETVTAHLRPGRGVLRRSPDGLVLSMSSTAGGPEACGLLAAWPTMFSGPMSSAWSYRLRSLSRRIGHAGLDKAKAAVDAFTKRTGAPPATLGELVAAGDLKGEDLLIPGDALAENIEHQGKVVGRSSFRWFSKGVEFDAQGQKVSARLVEIQPWSYERLCLDDQGDVHECWGDDASLPIQEVSKRESK